MKNLKFTVLTIAGFALIITGCAKKSTEQASISGTGFESISSTEELAQLPQSSTASQQASVEVLPLDPSPITQGVPPIAGPTQAFSTASASISSETTASGLTHEQQIQTALKNAGIYQGSVDGKLGPASKRAIAAFQTAHSLKADGKVGPKTWAALEPYVSGAPQTAVSTPSEQ